MTTKVLYIAYCPATRDIMSKIGVTTRSFADRFAAHNIGHPDELGRERALEVIMPEDIVHEIEGRIKTQCRKGDGEWVRLTPEELCEKVGEMITRDYVDHHPAYLAGVTACIKNPKPISTYFKDLQKERRAAGECVQCRGKTDVKADGKHYSHCNSCREKLKDKRTT